MKIMALFSNVTQTQPKDTFEDLQQTLTFVVEDGDLGRAIGRGGSNVRLLSQKLNRKIKIVAFNSDPLSFIKNFVFPLEVKAMRLEGDIVRIEPQDGQARGLLIGRGGQNLRNLENVLRRYFDSIKEVKVQ